MGSQEGALRPLSGDDVGEDTVLDLGNLVPKHQLFPLEPRDHQLIRQRHKAECLNRGIEVGVLGPGTLIPAGRHEFIRRFRSWDEVFDWKPDAVYLLRVQLERQEGMFFPSIAEYHKMYGMNTERLVRMRQIGAYLMHPGPVNRGVEITDEAMRYERSLISTQVENGIAVRMAVLHWLKPETDTD